MIRILLHAMYVCVHISMHACMHAFMTRAGRAEVSRVQLGFRV